MIYIITIIALFWVPPAFSEAFKVSQVKHDPGMFSVFTSMAGILHHYDIGIYSGIEIDLGTSGRYYDKDIGPNWISYFIMPIKEGNLKNIKEFPDDKIGPMAMFAENKLDRIAIHQLIIKYIQVKEQVKNEVHRFVRNRFKGKVIGVHYRGTDKRSEAPAVKFEKVNEAIKEQINILGTNDYTIFLATDEVKFMKYLKEIYKDKVIHLKTVRSNNDGPIHENLEKPFEQGKAAFKDMLLLSRCDILIRTSSNLSLWSTYFNPTLPVVLLNERYAGKKKKQANADNRN